MNDSKKSWNVFLLLASFGWINALISLWHRQKINAMEMDSASFCNISEKVNCDTVALSKYSAVVGVPTASWGMLFYAVLLFIALWAYFKKTDGHDDEAAGGATWMFVLSALALVPTLVLAGLSFFVVGSLCILCVITYLFNIALAGVAYSIYQGEAKSRPMTERLKTFTSSLAQPGWVVLAILVLLHVFSGAIVNRLATGGPGVDDKLISYSLQSFQIAQPRTFKLDTYPTFGPENAKVTVVEFSDFQCPYCARSAVTLPPLLKSYGSSVRYIYKPYPLDSSCNPQMKQSVHQFACFAAKAGLCVFDKKGSSEFFAYKSKVFSRYSDLNNDVIKQFASESGVAANDLEVCTADPKIHQKIIDSVVEGSANGVTGTPSVFINGKIIEMGPQPQALRAIIDFVLAQP